MKQNVPARIQRHTGIVAKAPLAMHKTISIRVYLCKNTEKRISPLLSAVTEKQQNHYSTVPRAEILISLRSVQSCPK